MKFAHRGQNQGFQKSCFSKISYSRSKKASYGTLPSWKSQLDHWFWIAWQDLIEIDFKGFSLKVPVYDFFSPIFLRNNAAAKKRPKTVSRGRKSPSFYMAPITPFVYRGASKKWPPDTNLCWCQQLFSLSQLYAQFSSVLTDIGAKNSLSLLMITFVSKHQPTFGWNCWGPCLFFYLCVHVTAQQNS